MAAMQGSNGPTCYHVVMRCKQGSYLSPCCGLRQKVFEQVVGKASIAHAHFARRRNGIRRAGTHLQLWQFLEASVEPKTLQLSFVVLDGWASKLAPNAKDGYLPVLDRIVMRKAVKVAKCELSIPVQSCSRSNGITRIRMPSICSQR